MSVRMLARNPAAPSSTGNAAYRRCIRGTRQGDIIRAVHITKYMGRIIAPLLFTPKERRQAFRQTACPSMQCA
jgi:hypothetical protein